MAVTTDRWMVCSACRKDIPYATDYFACSVSTCNRAATRLVFCSLDCWDSHLSVLRHRDAWAVEERSPPRPEAGAAVIPPQAPGRRPAAAQAAGSPAERPLALHPADESEILIVVSRLKKYIRDRSGMNTSDAVAERLSAHVRALCDAAIGAAAQDGRKTVLDRDVPPARR